MRLHDDKIQCSKRETISHSTLIIHHPMTKAANMGKGTKLSQLEQGQLDTLRGEDVSMTAIAARTFAKQQTHICKTVRPKGGTKTKQTAAKAYSSCWQICQLHSTCKLRPVKCTTGAVVSPITIQHLLKKTNIFQRKRLHLWPRVVRLQFAQHHLRRDEERQTVLVSGAKKLNLDGQFYWHLVYL